MNSAPNVACLSAILLLSPAASPAAVVLETNALRLEIADNATLSSLTSKPERIDYAVGHLPVAVACRGGRMVPLAEGKYAAVTGRWGYQGGRQFPATAVTRQGERLSIAFGEANATAIYRVRATDDYLAFELVGVEGEPVDRIEFLRLNVRRLPCLAQWINAVYEERFGICLCGGNLETNIEMLPQDDGVLLTAAAEAAVGLRGPTAVLLGCGNPKTRLLDAMAKVEADFHLPSGVAARRSPLQKLSYLWASQPTPENIDQYIRYAKLGGFRMILLSYTAFTKGAGHFLWNDSYPNGMADLKRVTDAIRATGVHVGLHLHYSKVRKGDPYLTPVPDPRLRKERRFTLAASLDATADTISVRENPAGCTLDKGRRIVQIGKELVAYQSYTSQLPYRFTGCERGHLQTTASPHSEGDEAGLLDVDTWDVFVRIDQQTDIQDEIAHRIAGIYRQTGPYAMVYFDGAEDVHEPFWYNVAASQYRVFRLLDPPPPVCESAHYTHFSWHMISRSNAYDTVAPADGMKDFCRLMPCPTAAARAMDFSRVQFGWLGRFGDSKLGYPGPDVFEYVASRAAAWDCPLSIHAKLDDLQSNPRAEDCLAAIKTWEDARVGDRLGDVDRCRLQNVKPGDAHYVSCYQQREIYTNSRNNENLTDSQRRILADRREHHLFVNERGRHELVDIEEVPNVAGGRVKAWLFHRQTAPADTCVLVWADRGSVNLQLPVKTLTAMRPWGVALPCQGEHDGTRVLIGPRTYLRLPQTDHAAAVQLLQRAQVVQPVCLRSSSAFYAY